MGRFGIREVQNPALCVCGLCLILLEENAHRPLGACLCILYVDSRLRMLGGCRVSRAV